MKAELIKQFVKKMVMRVLIFTVILFLITTTIGSIGTIVSNKLALTQMENSNTMYVAMTTYSRLKDVLSIVVGAIILWFVCTLGRDTYKFVKTINTKDEKEK